MTHLFKDRNVYISAQTQSEWIFFGGRRDWWIRDLGSSLTLQYHPVQFTDLGNFHRAHESLANTLLTLPSSLEVIDLEHLSFYTLRLGIQQGFSRKTKKTSVAFFRKYKELPHWSLPLSRNVQSAKKLSLSHWFRWHLEAWGTFIAVSVFTPCLRCHQMRLQCGSPGGPFPEAAGGCLAEQWWNMLVSWALVCELPAVTWRIKKH